MPWPVGIVLAVLVFIMFHTYQLVAPQDALNMAIFSAIRMAAYFFIFMFLFAAFLSFFTQRIRRVIHSGVARNIRNVAVQGRLPIQSLDPGTGNGLLTVLPTCRDMVSLIDQEVWIGAGAGQRKEIYRI